MAERFELDQNVYVYDNGRWYNAETFITPPQVIIRRLERRRKAAVRPKPRTKQAETTKPPAATSAKTKNWGKSFAGLEAGDFKRNVTGTTWRRKETLAGLLARRLSEASEYAFTSYAVPRRTQVFIYVPKRMDEEVKHRSAKFYFRLNEEKATYGFQVEKSNKAMDDKWDWLRFLKALDGDDALQQELDTAMAEHNLHWQIDVLEDDEQTRAITVTPDGPLTWEEDGEKQSISWNDFVERLRQVETDRWCDVWLRTTMEKAAAVGAGTSIADPVVDVFRALVPIYKGCWR